MDQQRKISKNSAVLRPTAVVPAGDVGVLEEDDDHHVVLASDGWDDDDNNDEEKMEKFFALVRSFRDAVKDRRRRNNDHHQLDHDKSKNNVDVINCNIGGAEAGAGKKRKYDMNSDDHDHWRQQPLSHDHSTPPTPQSQSSPPPSSRNISSWVPRFEWQDFMPWTATTSISPFSHSFDRDFLIKSHPPPTNYSINATPHHDHREGEKDDDYEDKDREIKELDLQLSL